MTFSSSPSVLPSEELLDAWIDTVYASVGYYRSGFRWLATMAAQWGETQAKADIKRQLQEAVNQELEACCEWMSVHGYHCGSERMRNDRRPKPLSLKKQAIALIDSCADPDGDYLDDNALTTIRRALEQLPDEQ